MHSLFLICLVGGFGATALLAMFGGIAGHAAHGLSHIHTGHLSTQLPAAHSHPMLPAAHTHAAAPGAGTHAALPGGHTAQGSQVQAASQAQNTVPAMAIAAQSPITAVVGWTLSWLSPLVLAAAALWFGAGGLLAGLAAPATATPVAILAAIVGAMVARLLIGAFSRADTEPLSAAAAGAIGVLNASIRADGVGEVVYVLEGLHRSAAARSVDGTPLPRGANVVIVRRERGIAYVSPLDPLSELPESVRVKPAPDTPARMEASPDTPVPREALP